MYLNPGFYSCLYGMVSIDLLLIQLIENLETWTGFSGIEIWIGVGSHYLPFINRIETLMEIASAIFSKVIIASNSSLLFARSPCLLFFYFIRWRKESVALRSQDTYLDTCPNFFDHIVSIFSLYLFLGCDCLYYLVSDLDSQTYFSLTWTGNPISVYRPIWPFR